METDIILRIGLSNESCLTSSGKRLKPWEGQVSLHSGLRSVVIAQFQEELLVEVLSPLEDVKKSKEGNAKLRYV